VEEMGSRGLTKRIKEWVNEGGRYLGICAGGYFGCTEVIFDMGGDLEVKGTRDLVSSWHSVREAS
jgi:biotin--protein ligase